MSFNSSNGTIDPGAFNGTIDPGTFASIMQGIQFLSSVGMSASQNSNMRGGNDPNLSGMSSSGAAMTHGNANTLKGTNIASNATGGTPRPSKSTTHNDSLARMHTHMTMSSATSIACVQDRPNLSAAALCTTVGRCVRPQV